MKIMSLKLAVIIKKSYLCERKEELHMPKIFEYFGFIFFFYFFVLKKAIRSTNITKKIK